MMVTMRCFSHKRSQTDAQPKLKYKEDASCGFILHKPWSASQPRAKSRKMHLSRKRNSETLFFRNRRPKPGPWCRSWNWRNNRPKTFRVLDLPRVSYPDLMFRNPKNEGGLDYEKGQRNQEFLINQPFSIFSIGNYDKTYFGLAAAVF